MDVGEAGQPRHALVEARVVLHGAGAERKQPGVDGVVLLATAARSGAWPRARRGRAGRSAPCARARRGAGVNVSGSSRSTPVVSVRPISKISGSSMCERAIAGEGRRARQRSRHRRRSSGLGGSACDSSPRKWGSAWVAKWERGMGCRRPASPLPEGGGERRHRQHLLQRCDVRGAILVGVDLGARRRRSGRPAPAAGQQAARPARRRARPARPAPRPPRAAWPRHADRELVEEGLVQHLDARHPRRARRRASRRWRD